MGKEEIIEDGKKIGELSDTGWAEGYMCRTDFNFEAGCALGGVTIYPTVEDLKKNRWCIDDCGYVKVKIVYVETPDAGNDFRR